MSPFAQNWSDVLKVGGENGIYFLYVGNKVEIYKRTRGWDNELLWLKFWRKDGIFQWVESEVDPGSVASSPEISGVPIVQLEEDIYWNFILRDSESSEEWPEKIYIKFFVGTESIFTCFQLNISWNGNGFLYGITDETFQENVEFTYEFYSNAFPLIELPSSVAVNEPVEGWTCLDDSDDEGDVEEDDVEDDEGDEDDEDDDEDDVEEDEKLLLTASVQALIEENKSLKEDLEAKNLMIQQLMEDTSSDETEESEDGDDYDSYAEEIYQERRIDPFDKEMYTKEEFQDYYGYDGFGDAMWDMNHPDKVSKVLMYEWILSRNENALSAKSKNHIMDKMIKTLCS